VEHPWTALALVALAGGVALRPVTLSGLKTHVVPTEPFVFCGLALCGPLAAVLVSTAGVLSAAVGRPKRPEPIRLAFNVSASMLSIAAASTLFTLAGGIPGGRTPDIVWPLIAAAAAYFLMNTGLVALAVALEKSAGCVATWKRSFVWMASSVFTGMALAICLLLVLEMLGPVGLALGIPPCWLMISFYRAHKARVEEQQRRTEEVETLNAELQRTVNELQDALAHVKQLQGLLPICMHCKRIRDTKDTWQRLETYIAHHSGAKFTHSLCDECRSVHYPEAACAHAHEAGASR
jgi:hypothetical protein